MERGRGRRARPPSGRSLTDKTRFFRKGDGFIVSLHPCSVNIKERSMTVPTEIQRQFPTREEAYAYLSMRGFLHMPCGWENGRWAADIDHEPGRFTVTAWLRAPKAA
jgi:hypothetical protein